MQDEMGKALLRTVTLTREHLGVLLRGGALRHHADPGLVIEIVPPEALYAPDDQEDALRAPDVSEYEEAAPLSGREWVGKYREALRQETMNGTMREAISRADGFAGALGVGDLPERGDPAAALQQRADQIDREAEQCALRFEKLRATAEQYRDAAMVLRQYDRDAAMVREAGRQQFAGFDFSLRPDKRNGSRL